MDEQRWKSLKGRKKLEWFIQYYGLKLVVISIIVAVIIYMLITVFGPHKDPEISVLILDDQITKEKTDIFNEELSKITECQNDMYVDVVGYLKNDSINQQAFSIKLTADNLDIVIAPKEEMEQLAENGFLVSLGLDPVLECYKDYPQENYLFSKNAGESGNTTCYGVKLSDDSKYCKVARTNSEKKPDEMYIGVTVRKKNDKSIEKALRYFMD